MQVIERKSVASVIVGISWMGMLALFVTVLVFDRRFSDAGRPDLSDIRSASDVVFAAAVLGSGVVGSVLALRRPGHPVAWLFLALAASISLAGASGAYATYSTIIRPGSLPGANSVAVYNDAIFLPWICILALILLLTPTGSPPSRPWRPVAWIAVGSTLCFLAVIPFASRDIEPPLEAVPTPLIAGPLQSLAGSVALAAVVVCHLALLAAIASVVVRVRRAKGEERQQLRWLLIPAIPFPFLVAGAWVAALLDRYEVLVWLGGGYLVIVPVAAALAIEKRRLYDVDRIVSRTVAYTLLTALVVVGYVAVVLVAGIAGGRAASTSVPAAVVASIAALGVGSLARQRLQDSVDRRFNRRAFAAHQQVRRHVREPETDRSIEDVLRTAAEDPSLTAAYWNDERASWVTEAGAIAKPSGAALLVGSAGGHPTSALDFDTTRVSRDLLASLAAEARPELENARLRAAINLQLANVRASRARLVTAQLEERRRIERDLHDGSQQRLLALAMNLRATELSGDAQAAARALTPAIAEIQNTVRELRELANGLHPSALEGGGLPAALHELAARTPLTIRLNILEERLPMATESSAWFIACEAVANVVKHAAANTIHLTAERAGESLVLSIEDDGIGGADPTGEGLRGISDRAEAAGGSLSVASPATGGTTIRAVLPCV